MNMKYGLSKNMELDNRKVAKVASYINDGIKQGNIKKYNGNLFDIKTLNIMINLDCLNCHKIHSVLCCDGVGYPPYDEDVELIFKMYKKILKSQCSESLFEAKKEHIERYGLLSYAYDFNNMYETMENYDNRTFRMHNGKCIFSVPVNKEKPDGAYRCAIHAFALQNNINVFDLKPKACQLFPVDIITIDNGSEVFDFVFGICDKTSFNRWGDIGYCVPYEKAKKVYKKTGAFNPDEYKPIYIGEKGLLIGLYGDGIIGFIERGSKK